MTRVLFPYVHIGHTLQNTASNMPIPDASPLTKQLNRLFPLSDIKGEIRGVLGQERSQFRSGVRKVVHDSLHSVI